MAETSTARANARLTRRLEAAERELQIQAAVDRVLQSALRMQTSEDVAAVVDQTYDALVDLGVGPVQIDINIVDKDHDLLGGTIIATSEVGAGTTFTVRLSAAAQ